MRFSQERSAENSVGYLLWQTRLHLGLKLEDVEHHLKIRRTYVQAIEQDDYNDMPGMAYVLGYIKNYALFLGLDPEMVAERFVREQEAFKRRRRFYAPEAVQDSLTPQHMPVLSSLFVMLLAYGVWYMASGDAEGPRPTVDPVPIRLEAFQRPAEDMAIFTRSKSERQGIQLTTSENVWIRVTRANGAIILDRFYRAGANEHVADIPGLRFTVSNRDAVQLSRGGMALQWPDVRQEANASYRSLRDVPLDELKSN